MYAEESEARRRELEAAHPVVDESVASGPLDYDPDVPYDTETQRRKRARGELPPLPVSRPVRVPDKGGISTDEGREMQTQQRRRDREARHGG